MNCSIVGDLLPADLLKTNGLTPCSTLQEVMENFTWGTYGPMWSQPLRWVKLYDCPTDHLINILRTETHILGTGIEIIIRCILGDRGLSQTKIHDTLNTMGYYQLKLPHECN